MAKAEVLQETALTNQGSKHFKLERISSSPKIDGVLDDEIWQSLEAIQNLHQVRPDEFSAPTEESRFWLAYDDDNLYVAARLFDTTPSLIRARERIQGKNFDSDDVISVALDPFNKSRQGYLFQVNPVGLRKEALIGNSVDSLNQEWEAIWFAAATIDENGWAVEIAIPIKSISFDPNAKTWGINLGRVIRRKSETLAWSSQGDNAWENAPAVMGKLGPIKNIHQGLGLDVKISGLAYHLEDTREDINSNNTERSMDIFYKPTPAITLVGTINTDFSTTEIDDLSVNTGRFSLKLAEKRDFFLQDANLYSFADLSGNATPFYSRRIGLDRDGQTIPLKGGIKLSSRFSNFNLGLLALQQQAPLGQEDNVELFVLRGTRNLLAESNIGFIYTRGDPLSSNSNILKGVDFNYNNSKAFGNKLIQASAWYQQSDDDSASDENSAYGFTLAYPNSRLKLKWSHKTIEANFNPALGFVNQRDIRRHDLSASYRYYLDHPWLLHFEPSAEHENINNTAGEHVRRYNHLAPLRLESVQGDIIKFGFSSWKDTVDSAFTPFPGYTVKPGFYDNKTYWYLQLKSSTSRPFYLQTATWRDSFFGAEHFTHRTTLGWRPKASWLLHGKHEFKRYDFPGGTFFLRLYSLRSELSITRDWAWFLKAQFDNKSNNLGMQSRLRWQPQADREVYFVINKGMHRDEENNHFNKIREEYALKASYTLRF